MMPDSELKKKLGKEWGFDTDDITVFNDLKRIMEIVESNARNHGIPKCIYCRKEMKNHIPKTGKFKGQIQKYSWVCDCDKYPKDRVLSIG